MRIKRGSSSLFIQDKQSVIDYLKHRKINSNKLIKFLQRQKFGLLDSVTFLANNELYEITHFLSKSEIMGYDIMAVNRQLSLDDTNIVAIALVSGDDVICVNNLSNEVFLWKIQTGNGEEIIISKSLDEFFEKITNKEKAK